MDIKIVVFIISIIVFLFVYNNYFAYIGIYERHILSKGIFQQLCDICKSYNESNMILDPKADNRRFMHVFPLNDPIYEVIFNDEFITKIRKLCGNQHLEPCLDIPIEYRKYVIGSYMDWHSDMKMLPDQLQYECVITLTNTSDSKTIVNNWFGLSKKSIITEPNSILIVRANGVKHCVTKITKGERSILKLAFCTKN